MRRGVKLGKVAKVRQRRRWTKVLPYVLFLLALGAAATLPFVVLSSRAPETQTIAVGCVVCHSAPISDAQLYVAVNGVETSPADVTTVQAGTSLEVDFHFTNVLGDPNKYSAVGAQITVQDIPPWAVESGTTSHPLAWSDAGKDATFWDSSWDAGNNGKLNWASIDGQPGAYGLGMIGLGEDANKMLMHGAVLADRGQADPADFDKVANHAGADALVRVPKGATNGMHYVVVSAVGHNAKGELASISRVIAVNVEGGNDPSVDKNSNRPTPTPGASQQNSGNQTNAQLKPTPVPLTGPKLYQIQCAPCHGSGKPTMDLLAQGADKAAQIIDKGSGQMPAMGGGSRSNLNSEQIGLIIRYLASAGVRDTKNPIQNAAPTLQHGLAGLEGQCLVCHGRGGVKPMPGGHSYNTSDVCFACHRVPPKLDHTTVGRETCTWCHPIPSK